MRKPVIITILVFFTTFVFAQSSEGIRFVKRIENRYHNNAMVILPDGRKDGVHNLAGKERFDKLLFGDRNGDVEFVVSPSFSGAYGFRITIDTLAKKCTLETKRVLNKKSVDSLLHVKYPVPTRVIKRGEPLPTYSEEEREERNRQTRVALSLQENERWGMYDVETLEFRVSCAFANLIHEKVATAIDTFKPGGRLTATGFDGEWIVFRATAGDELWTLGVHSPWTGETKRLTVIFTQMIDDAVAGVFDESKYIELLNNQ